MTAEVDVASCALLSRAGARRCVEAGVGPEHFADDACRAVYRAAVALGDLRGDAARAVDGGLGGRVVDLDAYRRTVDARTAAEVVAEPTEAEARCESVALQLGLAVGALERFCAAGSAFGFMRAGVVLAEAARRAEVAERLAAVAVLGAELEELGAGEAHRYHGRSLGDLLTGVGAASGAELAEWARHEGGALCHFAQAARQ